MPGFQPQQLRRLIKRGIKWIAAAKELSDRKTRDFVAEQMEQERTASSLRTWSERTRKTPIDEKALSKFAIVCLNHAPEVNTRWVNELFSANGMSTRDMTPALRQILRDRAKGESQPAEDIEADLSAPLAEYVQRVAEWAKQARLIQGNWARIDQGYVHSRLVRLQWPEPREDPDSLFCAETLLHDKEAHVAIVAPPGSGKSMLWQRLNRLLAVGVAGDVPPVPLDLHWADLGEAGDAVTLLEIAIQKVWPQCPESTRKQLAFHFQDRLEEGTAAILLDNWDGIHTLPEDLADHLKRLLAQWHRVFILGRYEPSPRDVDVQPYVLTPLNNEEVYRFVRAWPMITGYALDTETTIAQISISETLDDLIHTPLFLDLMCAELSQQPGQQLGRWVLLDSALKHLTRAEARSDLDANLFRAALAKLAWRGYTRENHCNSAFFDAAETYQLWRNEMGEIIGERFLTLAYERGLLRQAGRERLAFSHPALQAALVAEEWMRRADWLDHLQMVKSQPPWADVIIFASAILGRDELLAKLEHFLECLCDPDGADVLGLNWLLAGQCLAELNEPIRERLEARGIGKRVRQQLWNLSSQSHCTTVHQRVRDILSRSKTEAMAVDLATIALNRRSAVMNRQAAIAILGKIGGDQAVDTLAKIALNPGEEWRTRAQAIEALGHTRHKDAVRHLTCLAAGQDYTLWEPSVYALADHNTPDAARILLNQASDKAGVWNAVEQLSNPEVMPVLEQSLSQHEAKVASILSAMSRIGGPQATTILARLLRDDTDVTEQITSALGNMRTPAACEALIAFAEEAQQLPIRRYEALAHLPREHGLWEAARVIALLLRPTYITNRRSPQVNQDLWNVVRQGAIEALARTADASACKQLENAFQEASSSEEKYRIVYVLAHMRRRELVPLLLRLTQDSDPRIRDEAIYGLGMLREPSAVDIAVTELERALQNNWSIDQLCWALGEIGNERAVPILLRILRTVRSHWLQELAGEALGKIGGEEASSALVEKWRCWSQEPSTRLNRKAILKALARSGEPLCVQTLIEAGTCPDVEWPEEEALSYLRYVRNSAATDALIEALTHPVADVREYAAEALGYIGNEKAIPGLVVLAGDENKWVREAAFMAINRFSTIREPVAVQALTDALHSSDANERNIGVIGLCKLPTGTASDDLLSCIQDLIRRESNSTVLHNAVYALGLLGGSGTVPFLCNMLPEYYWTDTALAILKANTRE